MGRIQQLAMPKAADGACFLIREDHSLPKADLMETL